MIFYTRRSTRNLNLWEYGKNVLLSAWLYLTLVFSQLLLKIIMLQPCFLGVLVALGGLASWHSKLISRGETSIEANINKAETKRLTELGRVYVNPYDFGSSKNWRIFLGLVQGRTFIRHVLFPSAHEPCGDGLTWHTVHDKDADNWP